MYERHLFQLLLEKEKFESISHQHMPNFDKHVAFVRSKPYKYWWVIYDDKECVGALYLSHGNEIGIFIYKEHRRQGYAKRILGYLIGTLKLSDCYFANINADNEKSIQLFTQMGFIFHTKRCVGSVMQMTYIKTSQAYVV